MSEAIAREAFTIKELANGGSVSEVRVVNGLDQPVLLIEETGATV